MKRFTPASCADTASPFAYRVTPSFSQYLKTVCCAMLFSVAFFHALNAGQSDSRPVRQPEIQQREQALTAADASERTEQEEEVSGVEEPTEEGHLDVVKYLTEEQNVDAGVARDNGWTALHSASRRGHLSVVRYLVEHGANCEVACPERLFTYLLKPENHYALATAFILCPRKRWA